MDLQSWFYTLAIVNMALWIILLIVAISVVFSVYVMIKNAPKRMEERFVSLVNENKNGLFGMVIMTIVPIVLSAIKKKFQK